jgi:hypothetical protein
MSSANPLWGAPRIHGELLKLGIDVGQTIVVCAENLNPDVLVMQPANQGVRHDASEPLNRRNAVTMGAYPQATRRGEIQSPALPPLARYFGKGLPDQGPALKSARGALVTCASDSRLRRALRAIETRLVAEILMALMAFRFSHATQSSSQRAGT